MTDFVDIDFEVSQDTPFADLTNPSWHDNDDTSTWMVLAASNEARSDTSSGRVAGPVVTPPDENYFAQTYGTLGADETVNRLGVVARWNGVHMTADVPNGGLSGYFGFFRGGQRDLVIMRVVNDTALWIRHVDGPTGVDENTAIGVRLTAITDTVGDVFLRLSLDTGSGFQEWATVTDSEPERITQTGYAGIYANRTETRFQSLFAETTSEVIEGDESIPDADVDPPTNIRFSNVTENSFTVEWDPPGEETSNDVDEAAWEELDIVPMPKQLSFTESDVSLDSNNVAIVIGSNPSDQSQIAADWLNKRFEEKGGPGNLSIYDHNNVPSGKTVFVIGTIDDNPIISSAVSSGHVNVGTDNPGLRGYEIRRNGDEIYLAGADNIGALYAAVTVGEMLHESGGNVVWRSADIRDWPDFSNSGIGDLYIGGTRNAKFEDLVGFNFSSIRSDAPSQQFEDDYMDLIEELFGDLLRRKASHFRYSTGWTTLRNAPAASKALIKEGVEWGEKRGIRAMRYFESPFVALAEDEPSLETEIVRSPRYDAWIRGWKPQWDSIREETAESVAEFVADVGWTDIAFHDTDTGGYNNPAQWNERGQDTINYWGNDFAGAVERKMKIYYDEMKALNPDATVHFTFYPYNIDILRDGYGEPELRQEIEAIWQHWNDTMPSDVTFTIRENRKQPVDDFREIWQHGVLVWNLLGRREWASFVDVFPSFQKTFFRDNRDVSLHFPVDEPYVPIRGLMVHEYSWNVETPGADIRENRPNPEQAAFGERTGPVFELITPRIIRNLFGAEAGPDVYEAVMKNFAPNHIFWESGGDAGIRSGTTDMLDTSSKMGDKALLAEQARDLLDGVWDQWVAGTLDLDGPYGHLYLTWLREVTHNTMWTARIRERKIAAQEFMDNNNNSAAETAIDQGLDFCDDADIVLGDLLSDRPSDFTMPVRRRYLADGGGSSWGEHEMTINVLRQELQDMKDSL